MWSYANFRDRLLGMQVFKLIKDKKIALRYNSNGKSNKGNDQDFLGAYVWPIAKKNATIHDSFFCKSFDSQASPFPTKREKFFCFVPCAHCCDERLFNKVWTDVCPEACRPKEHLDWIYC